MYPGPYLTLALLEKVVCNKCSGPVFAKNIPALIWDTPPIQGVGCMGGVEFLNEEPLLKEYLAVTELWLS